MLRRTRVGTTPDLTRISAGVQRPGIDPRINGSRAEALTNSTIDAEHGHFVDVQLLPSGLELTCRVAQDYAGSGFGNHYGLVHEGDEVFVVIPEGDPSLGPLVVARMWSEHYAPPSVVKDNPDDTCLVVEKDTNYRIQVSGTGQWIFHGEDEIQITTAKKTTVSTETFIADTSNVRLGSESAAEALILGNTYSSAEQQLLTQISTAFTTLTPAGAMLASAGAIMIIPIVGAIIAGPMVAAAGAAITSACPTAIAAIAAFTTPYSTYLSATSKTT